MSLIEEGLTRSLHSSDLRWHATRTRDVDYITALGMAGMHDKLASKLYRLVTTMARSAYFDVLPDVMHKAAGVARRRGWKVADGEVPGIARQALDHLVRPACPSCHGRGFAELAGTGRLSGVVCGCCRGTGKRPVKDGRVRDLLAEIENFASVIEAGVARRLFARG